MSLETKVRKRLSMLIGLLVIVLLACNPLSPVSSDAAMSEAGTQIAMRLTQTAMALPTTTNTVQSSSTATEVALPTATRPAQASLTATEIALPVISESDVAEAQVDFTYDEAIFSQVERMFEEGHTPEGLQESIFFPDHLFYDFTYADESVDSDYYGIRVWPVAEYAAMNPYAAQRLIELQAILAAQPALELNSDYPVLPPPMAAMWMSTQGEYLTFQNGSGIRYVVQRVQQAAPITNHSLRYRFIGLTDDARYYISATFMASHPLLPDDPEQYFEENGSDWATFIAEQQSQYRVETAELLAAQSPDSFDPSLLVMDEMIQSLKVGD